MSTPGRTSGRHGSRRAVRAPRRPRREAVLALVLVVLAALAVVATAGGDPVRPSVAPSSGRLVDSTLLACPDLPPSRGVDASVTLGLAPAPAGEDVADAGTVEQGPVDGEGADVDLARGSVRGVDVDGGPAVRAAGDAAAGLFGFRTDVAGGRDTALAVGRCPVPRAQWWFTGAGATLDHSSTLVLSNVDPGPAVVDVRVLGPDGEVETVGTEGITVESGTTQVLALTDLAPQTEEATVSVVANRGRVVAAVQDVRAPRPGVDGGREWLSGVDRPSRTSRIAGLPSGARSTTLLVANPGELETVVEVQVAGRTGRFAPTGLDPVEVAPGVVERVDLSDVVPDDEPVSLRLTSRVPVVAGVRSSTRTDHQYAAPVLPLTGPAVAPLDGSTTATVQLTAGAGAARAGLTAYDAKGRRLASTTLDVAATATAAWTPEVPRGRTPAYLVLTPVAGRVHGAVTYRRGSGTKVSAVSTVPLVALPFRVQEPTVVPAVGG